MAFKYFDSDRNGGISASDLNNSIGKDRSNIDDFVW
jgi:hypothetical protein